MYPSATPFHESTNPRIGMPPVAAFHRRSNAAIPAGHDIFDPPQVYRPNWRCMQFSSTVKWSTNTFNRVVGQDEAIDDIEERYGVSIHTYADTGTLKIVGALDKVAVALGECQDLAECEEKELQLKKHEGHAYVMHDHGVDEQVHNGSIVGNLKDTSLTTKCTPTSLEDVTRKLDLLNDAQDSMRASSIENNKKNGIKLYNKTFEHVERKGVNKLEDHHHVTIKRCVERSLPIIAEVKNGAMVSVCYVGQYPTGGTEGNNDTISMLNIDGTVTLIKLVSVLTR